MTSLARIGVDKSNELPDSFYVWFDGVTVNRHATFDPFMDKQRLTDAEARKLLERASELDAQQAQTLDIATFREIAAEAGISPAAVDAALRESATPQQAVASQPGPMRLTLRVIGRVAFGFGFAFIVYVVVSIITRLFLTRGPVP